MFQQSTGYADRLLNSLTFMAQKSIMILLRRCGYLLLHEAALRDASPNVEFRDRRRLNLLESADAEGSVVRGLARYRGFDGRVSGGRSYALMDAAFV